MQAKGFCRALVTLGKRGCAYVDGNDIKYFGIYPVRAVDSTAAGDSFIGGLCAKLCEGKTLDEAVAYASAVSAIAVSRHGASASIPTALEVEEFLRHNVATKG
jgi:ribokinase